VANFITGIFFISGLILTGNESDHLWVNLIGVTLLGLSTLIAKRG